MSKFDVIKEALLLKQVDHPCFPFVNGTSVERKPYLLVLQFCNVEGKVYSLHRALHSHSLVLKNQEWLDIIKKKKSKKKSCPKKKRRRINKNTGILLLKL